MFTEVSKKIVVKKLDLSKKEASSLCQAVVLNDFNCWKQVISKLLKFDEPFMCRFGICGSHC